MKQQAQVDGELTVAIKGGVEECAGPGTLPGRAGDGAIQCITKSTDDERDRARPEPVCREERPRREAQKKTRQRQSVGGDAHPDQTPDRRLKEGPRPVRYTLAEHQDAPPSPDSP